MFKIIIENEKQEQLTIIVTKRMVERFIDMLYPSKGLNGISKGYIELVNHVMKG